MSDLFGSLAAATRALEAQRFGLDVTGQNIANVNTPGYSRRVADFEAVPPYTRESAGGGVDVAGVRAMRDRLVERRLYQELSAEQRESAVAEALAVAETALGPSGASIDARLTAFFDAFAQLAASPTSAVARQEVVVQGESIATAFRTMVDRFESSQRDADNKIRAAVEEANGLVDQITAINRSLASASATGGGLHLRDQQSTLVRQLSEILDVDVLERADGGVDISFGNGRPLVIGENAYQLGTASTPPLGFAAITSGNATVTSEITSGRLGGLLHVRDVSVPGYLNRLDTLANELVTQVNALHTAGFDQAGNAGLDFFVFASAPSGVTGAAKAIGINGAIAANGSLVAAAGTAQAGDNNNARAIAGLRAARVLEGNTATLTDAWSQLVYRAGRDAQAARDERQSRSEIVSQVDALRDQVSGISLDEEAMQLLKFQRAYEANARFFSAVDRLLDTLLQTLAR